MSDHVYTTKHVAAELGISPKILRRHLRALDIRCGSGDRHILIRAEAN